MDAFLIDIALRYYAPLPIPILGVRLFVVCSVMTELDKALAWAECFYALIRQRLALHPDGPDAQHWRNWQFMLSDYRFWNERDPELKSLGA